MDILNEFNFTVHYIPGEMNVLLDTLSRIYSDKPLGIVYVHSEYVGDDSSGIDTDFGPPDILRPLYTGVVVIIDFTPRCLAHLACNPKPAGTYRAMHEGQPLNDPAKVAPASATTNTPVDVEAALTPDECPHTA